MKLNITQRLTKQKGFGLAETLVAVAILGTAVVAFIAALSTGIIGTGEYEQEVTAQQLVQNQLESIKSQAFLASGAYTKVSVPSGYTLNVASAAVPGGDVNIQKITVTVLRSGTNILQVSGYKVNR
jgi:prepilin-type N-terminal cleavage/methylation domain-containing protein